MSDKPDKASNKTRSDAPDQALFNEPAAKILEAQIRQQAAIIDHADLGVAVYRLEDPNDPRSLRLLSLNSAAARILQAEAQDLTGKLVLEAFPSTERESLERNARVALSGVPADAPDVHYPGDSRMPEAYFSAHAVPLGDNTMAVLFQDVTERRREEEALQTTLQRLRTLVSSMHGSVLLVGEDRIELANQAFCDYFGLKDAPADLVGLTAAEMIARIKNAYLDPDEQTSRIAEIVGKGKPIIGEEVAMRGGRLCLRDFIPISMDGKPRGRLWYHADITERKRAEEALRRSESMLRSVLDQIPSGVTIRDARSGDLLLSNSRSREIMGKIVDGPSEFARYRGLHPDGRPYTTEEWPVSRSMATGEVVDAEEIPCERSDGTSVTLSMSSAPVRDSQGQIIVGVGVFHDITERKQAEEALRDSEYRYRTLLESAPDAIVVHREGRLLYANPAALELYGAGSFEELAAHNIMELANPNDAGMIKERLRAIQAGQNVPVRETSIVRLDGREVPVEVISSPVQYEGERAAQIMARDITERKRAQAEIDSLARFPSENPNPILRISRYGVLMYANQASRAWLEDWGCAVGEMAPETVRALIGTAFAKRRPKQITVDIGLVGRIWSVQVIPIAGAGYANIYGRDITDRRRAEDALRESEARAASQAEYLRTLLNIAPAIVWVAEDRECKRIVANRAGEEFLRVAAGTNVSETGDEPAKVAHYRMFHEGVELVRPEELPFQRAARGETFVDYTFDFLFDDGEWRNTIGNITPLFDAEGQPSGAVGVFTDITGRRRAEQAVRESQERLAAITDSIADGFYALDRDWRITHVNDAALAYFGKKREEMLNRNLLDIYPAIAGSTFEREYKRAMETGRPAHFEGQSVATDSIVEMHAYPGPDNLTLLFRNVTARKQAEEEIRLQANALQAAANGIVITDPSGVIQWVNDAFTRLTGYSAEEVIGGNPRVLKSGQHDKLFYQKLWKTILAGRVWQGELVNKRKDGTLYPEEQTITPVRGDDGKIANFIAIKQDVLGAQASGGGARPHPHGVPRRGQPRAEDAAYGHQGLRLHGPLLTDPTRRRRDARAVRHHRCPGEPPDRPRRQPARRYTHRGPPPRH